MQFDINAAERNLQKLFPLHRLTLVSETASSGLVGGREVWRIHAAGRPTFGTYGPDFMTGFAENGKTTSYIWFCVERSLPVPVRLWMTAPAD